MASVNVTEYSTLAPDVHGQWMPVGKEPAVTAYDVAGGASSAQGPIFQDATLFVRVQAVGGVVRVAFGANPTAVATSSTRLESGQTEYFGVSRRNRLAVIDAT